MAWRGEVMIIDLRINKITNDSFGNLETISSIENISGGSYLDDILHGDDNDNDVFGICGRRRQFIMVTAAMISCM